MPLGQRMGKPLDRTGRLGAICWTTCDVADALVFSLVRVQTIAAARTRSSDCDECAFFSSAIRYVVVSPCPGLKKAFSVTQVIPDSPPVYTARRSSYNALTAFCVAVLSTSHSPKVLELHRCRLVLPALPRNTCVPVSTFPADALRPSVPGYFRPALR